MMNITNVKIIFIKVIIGILTLVVLFLIFRPNRAIPTLLFTPSIIDSILIDDYPKKLITDSLTIRKLSQHFEGLRPTLPSRLRLNTKMIHLYVFGKGQKVPLNIFYCKYDGIVIDIYNKYYKNDSVAFFIDNQLKSIK